MIPAYTGTQIRAAEAPLLEAGRGPELMNLAAHGLARHTAEMLRRERGRVYGTRVAALVGTGNNGGDALFAMALLAKRGVACTAVLLGKNAHDAGLAAFRKAGGRVVDGRRTNGSGSRGDSRRWRAASTALDGVDLVIDAVLGTGAKGGVELPEIPGGALVVACDLPSGVDADTGDAPDTTLRADLTVTFGALKTGLTVGKGHLLSGRIEVVDIGLRPHLGEPDLHVIEPDDAARLRPRPRPGDHKYTRGVLGLVAGSAQYPGAAILSATAAVNTGLGMLRTITPESVRPLLAQAVPEAVAAENADVRVQAWAVGPGIGDDESQIAAAKVAIASGLPCVVDASALDTIKPEDGHGNLVLTPHAGELQRLLERAGMRVDRSTIERDPVRWARWAAVGYSSVVLLKGPATVCASPEGHTVVCNSGGPELATAGSGDVLAGVLGAFLCTGNGAVGAETLALAGAAATELHARTSLTTRGQSASSIANSID